MYPYTQTHTHTHTHTHSGSNRDNLEGQCRKRGNRRLKQQLPRSLLLLILKLLERACKARRRHNTG